MHLSNKKKKTIFILAGAVLSVIAAGYFLGSKNDIVSTATPLFTGLSREEPTQPKSPSILTGELVDENVANRRPLGVMIENHVDARPQSGLNSAGIVFEAIAEGGITRFLALFSATDVDKIGPVRSARQYYVEWAKGFEALYAHVGGSQDGLARIKQLGLVDLDQFRWGTKAYWREPKPGLAIEHTMYTSTAKLYQVVESQKVDLTGKNFYPFKDDADVAERGSMTKLSIFFSTAAYQVNWTYESESNSYARFHSETAHVDRTKDEQISAKNVVVVTMPRQLKEGGNGWQMTTTGKGKARIFQDGQEVVGTWQRQNMQDAPKFFDESGSEIKLNRGRTWIEVISNDIPVEVL